MSIRRSTSSIIAFAAIAGLSAVALSAFAEHGAAKIAPAEKAVSWILQATDFQMNHALALILIAVLTERMADGLARTLCLGSAALMVLSIFFFPGSLYSLSFNGPGDLAPVGGFCAMIGWAVLGIGALVGARKGEFAPNMRVQVQPAE